MGGVSGRRQGNALAGCCIEPPFFQGALPPTESPGTPLLSKQAGCPEQGPTRVPCSWDPVSPLRRWLFLPGASGSGCSCLASDAAAEGFCSGGRHRGIGLVFWERHLYPCYKYPFCTLSRITHAANGIRELAVVFVNALSPPEQTLRK